MSTRKWLIIAALLLTGGTATAVVGYRGVIFFGDGSSASVSANGTGAIRYNNTSHAFEQSTNGGSWSAIGGTSYDPNTVYALSLPGSDGIGIQTHVNHGTFWQPSITLGNSMYWRAWINNTPTGGGTGYLVSDGYGGAHALLWNGYGAGNINTTPGGTISYGSDDTIPDGQWFENAIGIVADVSGQAGIVTWMNGVAVGFTSLGANTRRTVAAASGAGTLYVGGSSHSQWNGQLAMLEAFDQVSPFTTVSNYAPERTYSTNNANGPTPQPDLLVDYSVPSRIIADQSWGYSGDTTPTLTTRVKHPGHLFNLTPALAALGCYSGLPCESPAQYPLPSWVATTGGPWTTAAPPTPPGGRSLTPPSTPPGAKVFDSFSRQDQTFAFSNAPTLGSTEAGSLGPLAWQCGTPSSATPHQASTWGIFNGAAVVLDSVPTVCWVTNNSANATVSVDNRPGTYGSGVTEVAFRVQDASNWWVCGVEGGSVTGLKTLYLGHYVAGSYSLVSSTASTVTVAQHTVTAITSGTSITCQVDNGATWQLTATDSTLQTATGMGLAQNYNAAINEGLARWDNFTVK